MNRKTAPLTSAGLTRSAGERPSAHAAVTAAQIAKFRRHIRQFYRSNQRDLPWRRTSDGYRILVSEIMLQQTQVARVEEKYRNFLRQFPNPRALARSPLPAVLQSWQGLGYNRRARALKKTAEVLVAEHGGKLPSDEMQLRALPGIGPYTAAALLAFVHNQPAVLVETNVRTVMIHWFFGDREAIGEGEIEEIVRRTVDRKDPRNWYYALMDYGAHLKRTGVRTNHRMSAYVKQSPFAGSNRQVRGAILRELTASPNLLRSELRKKLVVPAERIEPALAGLLKDGLISCSRNRYRLSE